MRGLTPEERVQLADGFAPPGELVQSSTSEIAVAEGLVARGLFEWVLVERRRDPVIVWGRWARTTPTGILALRLDALAKGLVSA